MLLNFTYKIQVSSRREIGERPSVIFGSDFDLVKNKSIPRNRFKKSELQQKEVTMKKRIESVKLRPSVSSKGGLNDYCVA